MLLTLLAKVGIVGSKGLREKRRYAIVAIVVVAAIGTAVIAYHGADPVLTDAPTPVSEQQLRELSIRVRTPQPAG